jgi:DNA-binding PadR family transcriptional regulator
LIETEFIGGYDPHGWAVEVLAHRTESVEKFIQIIENCSELHSASVYMNLHDLHESGIQIFEGDMKSGMAVRLYYNNGGWSEFLTFLDREQYYVNKIN